MKAPINILNGNHIVGALIGSILSAPITAWVFYWVGNALTVDPMRVSFPVVVTVIAGAMGCYGALAYFFCWLFGGNKDMI